MRKDARCVNGPESMCGDNLCISTQKFRCMLFRFHVMSIIRCTPRDIGSVIEDRVVHTWTGSRGRFRGLAVDGFRKLG